jgi:hypothetical protein
MRGQLFIVAIVIGACSGERSGSPDAPSPDRPDATSSPDDRDAAAPEPDASTPDGGTPCGSPPGDWAGTARSRHGGASTYSEISVDVGWTRVETTTGCVDRLVPSGTARYQEYLDCSGTSVGAIEPTDGEMIIDRTTSPATFELRGESRWEGTLTCNARPPREGTYGGVWAAGVSGAIDGAVIAGGILPGTIESHEVDFRFVRTDAVLTPPETCSEPAEATWSGPTSWGAIGANRATATWTRVSTVGCVDRFAPAGTMNVTPAPLGECIERSYVPSSGAIDADDGYLEIDRSYDPPRFAAYGDTSWMATVTCTHADGTTSSYEARVGGWWALHTGEIDGDHVAVRFEYGPYPFVHAWTLTRP